MQAFCYLHCVVLVSLNFSLTCSWTACSDVIDIQKDWNIALMSDALAREPWRSGKWMKMRLVFYQIVGVVLCHLAGYGSSLYSDSSLLFSDFHLLNIFLSLTFICAYSSCKVSGSDGSDFEDYGLLDCDTM